MNAHQSYTPKGQFTSHNAQKKFTPKKLKTENKHPKASISCFYFTQVSKVK